MHIQNIFNVLQVVDETKELIKEGKLLEAHRKYVICLYMYSIPHFLNVIVLFSLADLERTRDELLIQLYHSDDSYTDKNTVSVTNSLIIICGIINFECLSIPCRHFIITLNHLRHYQ